MFIDEVMQLPPYPPFPQLTDIIRKCCPVNIDNIAKYYSEDNPQEIWNLTKDFPNIAPPWPNIWFEWSPPAYVNSVETGV